MGARLPLAALLSMAPACWPRPPAASPPRPTPRPAAAAPAAPRAWRYDFAVDAGDTLRATLCFVGPAPERLVAYHPRARARLRGAWSGGVPLPITPDGIVLRNVGPDACVRYEAMVNPAPVDVSFWLRPDARVDGTILAMSRWLWFPSRYAEAPVVTARFSVPPSLHLSLPWPRVAPDTFRVDASSFTREGYVGLSRRPVVELAAAGATLSVAGFNGALTSDDGPARAWLTRSAALVAGLYGAFPATAVQVLLVGRADLAAPTGFGLASSAGGASVLFLVRPGADAAALAADDTAIHEFVHLGQAVTATANYWLGEGLATYYQHVLRARAGLITPAAAWTTLHQGFTRGRADRSGHALTDDSAALHREFHFSRVYWTGAALALLADVALRSGTPARTLDDAVRAALAGCGDRSREYGAAEILACMDAAGGGPVLTNLAARYAASVEFPGLGPLYERLGLRVVGDRVELGAAPDADLRDAIMAPRP